MEKGDTCAICGTCAHAMPTTEELYCYGHEGREGEPYLTWTQGEACANHAPIGRGPLDGWDVPRLARLVGGDCGECEARMECDDMSGTCEETRAAWLLRRAAREGVAR